MSDNIKYPDAVMLRARIEKSTPAGPNVSIIVADMNGSEITRFVNGVGCQDWLNREGYVYSYGSMGVWIKAPKVPMQENGA